MPPPPSKSAKGTRRKPQPRGVPAIVKWGGVIAVVGLLGYCATEMSGVAYGESAIRVVDFSSLTPGQKRRALKEANRQRCNCGCGMTLAQCVSTDSTCPIREPNIERIKAIVKKEIGPEPG